MIQKFIEQLAEAITTRLKKRLDERDIATYSIAKEMQTIHDIEFTEQERDVLQTLQKNTTYKRILEKCCFALSLSCVNARTEQELHSLRAGVKALEFLIGEIEKQNISQKINPLTGLPIES